MRTKVSTKMGLPLLKKYGFNATLYVNTGTVGAGDYMTWHQLIDAQRSRYRNRKSLPFT